MGKEWTSSCWSRGTLVGIYKSPGASNQPRVSSEVNDQLIPSRRCVKSTATVVRLFNLGWFHIDRCPGSSCNSMWLVPPIDYVRVMCVQRRLHTPKVSHALYLCSFYVGKRGPAKRHEREAAVLHKSQPSPDLEISTTTDLPDFGYTRDIWQWPSTAAIDGPYLLGQGSWRVVSCRELS